MGEGVAKVMVFMVVFTLPSDLPSDLPSPLTVAARITILKIPPSQLSLLLARHAGRREKGEGREG
jgi:hypothetical protein